MNNFYKNILTKRFQTTMIGALFEFEQHFGYLWGHNKDEDDLTQQELRFLDMWDSVRNKILNNGNSQLRKTIADLESENNIKYKYHFYKKEQD
jgi:hypothetical protein